MSAVLRVGGLSVRFGGVQALADVDLEVGEGKLVGLIGPNGAGKTTLVDAVTGFVACTGGVELEGRSITALAPHARARLGLARTWQSSELFDDLTVGENLAVAAHHPTLLEVVREVVSGRSTAAAVDEALELVELGWAADLAPGELSHGQRRLVGVARGIAMAPRLLCLDEPAAGLDSGESVDLGRRLRRLADDGLSMLLIDHDMGLVLGICDHVYVLEFGRVIAAGHPDDVRRDPRVVAAYLGGAAAELAQDASGEAPPAEGAA